MHSHRTDVVKAGNYYAGHHTAQGTLVTVTRSGRTKPLGAAYDLWNKPTDRFLLGLQLQRSGWVFFADQGEFRIGDYQEIMNKASCLSLVSNAILVWNTL